jgi:hypothetical protein
MTEEELATVPVEVIRILPEETSRGNMVIAIERSARQLVVATADPLNVLALDEVRRITGLDVGCSTSCSRCRGSYIWPSCRG